MIQHCTTRLQPLKLTGEFSCTERQLSSSWDHSRRFSHPHLHVQRGEKCLRQQLQQLTHNNNNKPVTVYILNFYAAGYNTTVCVSILNIWSFHGFNDANSQHRNLTPVIYDHYFFYFRTIPFSGAFFTRIAGLNVSERKMVPISFLMISKCFRLNVTHTMKQQ